MDVIKPFLLDYELQVVAVLGYTLVAAINMPQLTIDHCGPLVKNLPLLMLVLLLWCATPTSATMSPRPRAAQRAASPAVPTKRSAHAS